jgi:hypothetical protein
MIDEKLTTVITLIIPNIAVLGHFPYYFFPKIETLIFITEKYFLLTILYL